MRNITILLLLLFCGPVVSAFAGSTNWADSILHTSSDTLMWAQEEALMQLEADSLYGHIWNSTQIRYGQAIPSPSDTLKLRLILENSNGYVHPVSGRVLSKFGRRGSRQHTGIDIKLQKGDTVRCAFDGRVRIAKTFSGYGKMVLVRHHNGLETIYSHLSLISVKENDWIKSGDLVGLGGRTGRATTEHLHFELRILGEPFDPSLLIDFENDTLKSEVVYYHKRKVATSLAALSKPKPMHNATQTAESHTVKKGDTLYAIARLYGTSIAQLCEWNQISTQQVLKIGMLLKVLP